MKRRLRTTGALLLAAVLSVTTASAGCWLETYWPLNNGDCKTLAYSTAAGPQNVGICVYSSGIEEYQVSVNTREDNGYEIHRIEDGVVWIPKVSVNSGWIKVYFDPPIYFLDDNLLMNGGTKRWTTTATQSGFNYSATFTVTVSLAGTVTVPAGTFHNCRSITVSETATVPGQGTFSAQFMTAVLAPRVGIIKKLVLEEDRQYWAQLVSGTVQGVSVTQLAGPSVPLPASITTQPRSLSVTHGGKATFSVAAKGSTDMQFQWLKDGQPIQDNARISGTGTATLTINRLSLADNGRYSATISNAACVVLSTNALLNVLADIPKVAISFPGNGQRVSNNVVTVRGSASDSLGIGEITVRVNTGSFVPASTTNNWTNWTAEVELPVAGTNWLVARAVDMDGVVAYATNRLQYVLSGPLVVGINGKGTINPNYHGKLLEIGKVHRMTATPAVGYAFSNWTDAVGMVITNKALVSFVMQSNLVFNANFVDIQKPVVTITAPTLNQRWSNAVFTVAGKATDNGQVAEVFYQLNGGDWTSASTANAWSNWTAGVTLTPGPNTVRAYAVDATGNHSTTNTVTLTYVMTYWLPDYFYPPAVGNRWIYDGKDWDGFPAQMEVKIADTNFPITCYSGTTAIRTFTRNVIRQQSAYGTFDPVTGNFFSNDAWEDYITLSNGWGMLGSDDTLESVRVDPPLLITNRLIVGQTVAQTRNIYLDGTYLGQATFKLQLLDVSDVTVPAGTFPNCLHVRITLTAGGSSMVHDDWMAESVGMVKQQGVSGDGAPERWELIRAYLASPTSVAEVADSSTNSSLREQKVASSIASAPSQSPPCLRLVCDGTIGTAVGTQLRLRFSGPAGVAVVIERSSDLLHWRPVQTNTVPAEGLRLTMPVDQSPRQFFRARLQ